ncbi:MAG: hypothetical protein P1P85_00205 [Patescibacteria group bacterium]|nr:hypothetical protein [Patescibacteria group bacterium]
MYAININKSKMENENLEKDENLREDLTQENETITKNEEVKIEEKSEGMKKIQKNKMTPKKILKIAALFIAFFLVWFTVVQYITADKYEAVVKVIEEGGKVGVNPMTERLDYGDLPKGNASTRFITIENSGSMDIFVVVVKYGGIAELIKINENNFVLSSGDKKKLELTLNMPISANKKGYEGKIVIFKLPKLF